MAKLGAQLLMQAALEAEVTEFLGRDRYQRAATCEDTRDGSRNGFRDGEYDRGGRSPSPGPSSPGPQARG